MSYNPATPGWPSYIYHSDMIGGLRMMLEVEVQPGNQHTPKHFVPDMWTSLDRLSSGRQPAASSGDDAWVSIFPAWSAAPSARRERVEFL